MRRERKVCNFIIKCSDFICLCGQNHKYRTEKKLFFTVCLSVMMFLITGIGMGLDTEHQFFSSVINEKENILKSQSILPDTDLHVFQIEEKNQNVVSIRNIRNNRTGSTARYGLFFFGILAVLLAIFQSNQESLVLHRDRYAYKQRYIIVFMHDMDGRKRIL